ncbi:hypothetical protein [Roseivivax sp. CAU 1753]
MMKTVLLTTHLDAPPDRVWDAINTPRLFLFVARPVMYFEPVDPPAWPERWDNRAYVLRLTLWCRIPFGRQTVRISRPATDGPSRQLRDNGQSALIRRWDHVMTVAPEGTGTRYSDHIEIEAGLLTPLIAAYARWFYGHRHRRFHKLVAADFDYDAA